VHKLRHSLCVLCFRVRYSSLILSLKGRAYVSIRQHTSAYVSIRQHTSAFVSIRQHSSAYVSIRQHTSAYVSIRTFQPDTILSLPRSPNPRHPRTTPSSDPTSISPRCGSPSCTSSSAVTRELRGLRLEKLVRLLRQYVHFCTGKASKAGADCGESSCNLYW
jgi:hypothetical protein